MVNDLDNGIAIIGQSCRFPGANNLEEFWDLLKEGRSAIRPFPAEREEKCQLGYMNLIQAGFLTCPVDEFDAQFFGISPREAPLIDPQQRLLLELTWESLEDSGISPQELRGTKTGVFVGIWQGDYDRLLHTGTRTASDLFHRYLGNAFSATASRISFCLGLHGPAVALESGCASSLGALHLACESLRRGESNVAICGGVNLILIGVNPFTGGAIDEDDDSIVLSKDFKCKTFDESANGFVRAEACGLIVLKPYVKAKSDNDKILAVILGSAMNNDGTGVSFGTPNADAQEYVYQDALINANVKPEEVTLLEAHGTGTPVGDPIEMDAITRVYSKDRKTPLYVGSVKTNVGHCEAASGMASVFKALLCLQHKMIPPHINLQKLNPRINLDAIPAIIPQELTPWNSTRRICGISSFSLSATNVHIIMEEAPLNHCTAISTPNAAHPYIVTVSAKTKEALKSLKLSYIAFLDANPEIQLYDIAYATNVGRAHHTYRTALTASSTSEVAENIKSENWIHDKAAAEKKGVVFLFPGQGCQFFGMTEELSEKFPIFRKALEKGDKLFQKLLKVSLFDVLWKNPEYLNKALYCQPAIVAVECALLQLWVSFGVTPDVVLGHSLGEFSAAVATGFFRFEEAMEIIIYRSLLVNNNIKTAGAMLVVSRDLAQVQNIIERFTVSNEKKYWIDNAAVNAEDEIVLSGQEDAVDEFRKYCLCLSISTTLIPSSHAFHSRDMDELLDSYGKKLSDILSSNHRKFSCKFLSATDAKFITAGFDVAYWQRHLRNSVQFSKAFALLRDEYKVFVEIGPQTILSSLAMRNHPSPESCIFCPSIRIYETNSSTFLKAVSKLHVNGIDINWRAITPKKVNHVNLPLYPFQREPYWFVSDEEAQCVKLHPLLGHEIQTPNPGKIYSNILRTTDLNYLNDHKVAGIVIYPAAAYIETLLAAGRDILQGGGVLKYPLVIHDFNIDGALDLTKPVTLQATAEQQEIVESNTIQYKINLHRKMANSGDFRFINPPSGLFTDMAIGPDIIRDIPKHHVEINVKAVALNFKDIFCILKPEGFHIPEKFLEAIGLDVAGIVTRVGEDVTKLKKGDEVFGMVATGGLASHAILHEKVLLSKPHNISFAEAAAIPAVYLTAYYCLVHLADIQPHHSVLIHVASGGVGLAAVNIVKAMGKEIYATAGSKRKRAYLKSIGIKYVYNSRNTEFSQRILNDTNGVGVDIVLNSLTGPRFIEASLAATSRGGHFIEIAKLNIWEVKEMNEKRPDVKYDMMNMQYEFDIENDEDRILESAIQRIEAEVQKGTFATLPVKCFPLEEIQSAFNYFQGAKQIGKVVLKMPKTELNSESGKLTHISQPFDAEGSYIITGGLGGIGLEVTKWMASKGAKHIILVGRSVPTPAVQKVLEGINNYKCKIYIFSMDVGLMENCERLFEFFKKELFLFPSVRGIFHAAGVLQDELLETQHWSNFESTMRPKASGVWNLHHLSLRIKLEYFVLFSSGVALSGGLGQSPHVVANRYLDAFAHYRHLLGLPALSINWGLWLNVGVAAGIANEVESKIGLTGFPPSVGIQALEQMLIEPEPQVGFILVKDWRIMKKLFNQGNYLDEIAQIGPEEDMFAKYDSMIEDIKNTAPEERAGKTAIVIECLIKETLKLPPNEKVDHDQNFNDLGVDSLMAMEMKGRIQKILGGLTIPISALQENRTIRKLSQYIVNVLNAEEQPTLPIHEMMAVDSILPEDIQLNTESRHTVTSTWRGILLTGATGHLGVHMLPEIQRMRPNLKIYCLVRAKTEAEAQNRIKEELKYFEISSHVDIDKIVAVAGDITLEKFGIEDENYEKLATEVDAVIHCAIRVNHIENYYDGSNNDMRTVNVLGFLNILKFSTTYSTKHVMYTSAVLSVTELEVDGSVPERFVGLDSYTKVDNAYLQSKCIAEALLEQATERGIPSTVFRIPALTTSTQNGIPTRSVNHGWNLFMAGTRIRKFPELDMGIGFPIYPVDVAAKVCIGIFLKDDSEDGVYNLLPDKPFSKDKFKEIAAECGFDFEFVPFEEWRQEMFEELNDHELEIFSSMYAKNDKNISKIYESHAVAVKFLNNTESNLKLSLSKVRRNFSEYEIVNEYSYVDLFRLQFAAHARKQKTQKTF